MIRAICIAFSLLIATIVVAQSITPVTIVDPARLKVVTYGGDSLDRALYILPSKKNNFLVAGLTYESGVGNPQMLNVSTDLSVTKAITHESNDFAFYFAGAPSHDGKFLLTGFTHIEDNGLDSYFAMANDEGTLEWTVNFGGEEDDRSYKCARTKDNGFVIAGQTSSSGDHEITGNLYKLSASGDLQWERLLGVTPLNRLYSVIELDNGDLIVSGITNANYPDNSDILMYRLDSEGRVIWEKRHGGPQGDIAHSLLKGPDNTFLIVGYTAEKSNTLSDPQILHFDANGNLIKQYLAVTGKDIRLINGYLDGKGNYIGTGFVRETLQSDWDILFCKLNLQSGQFDLKTTRISEQDEEAYHAAAFGNGKALIVGHTLGKGNGDVVLIEWEY